MLCFECHRGPRIMTKRATCSPRAAGWRPLVYNYTVLDGLQLHGRIITKSYERHEFVFRVSPSAAAAVHTVRRFAVESTAAASVRGSSFVASFRRDLVTFYAHYNAAAENDVRVGPRRVSAQRRPCLRDWVLILQPPETSWSLDVARAQCFEIQTVAKRHFSYCFVSFSDFRRSSINFRYLKVFAV